MTHMSTEMTPEMTAELAYCHVYRDGQDFIVVSLGMPETYARVGTGPTVAEAYEDLEATGVQCTGRDGGLELALQWAADSGWCSASSTLEEDDGSWEGSCDE